MYFKGVKHLRNIRKQPFCSVSYIDYTLLIVQNTHDIITIFVSLKSRLRRLSACVNNKGISWVRKSSMPIFKAGKMDGGSYSIFLVVIIILATVQNAQSCGTVSAQQSLHSRIHMFCHCPLLTWAFNLLSLN